MGNDAAFVRLWRDANPMLTRYLRVAGVSDPRESAQHVWTGVIRDLSSFSGDEIAWRTWVLGLVRESVAEDAASHGRGARTHRPSRLGGHRGDDRSTVTQVEGAELRGVNDTIAAIRDLPLGQGEILMLRLMAELPVARVADLVGTDVVAVRRSEDRAVERLGAERELLAWSLAAPALAEELADQRVALAAFRGRGIASPVPGSTRVVAVLPGAYARQPNAGKPNTRQLNIRQPSTGKPDTRTSPTAVRSRLAVLCIAAISASAMSAGALSAAAYVGVLPQGLQQVMHNAIGAPAATVPTPTHSGASPSGQPASGALVRPTGPTAPTTGAGGAVPSARPRRAGAGTPPPHDTTAHRTSTAKASPARSQAPKTPTAKTPTARPAPSKAPTKTPKATGAGSRTPPAAKPTAGLTSPAKDQATTAHPAKPAMSQRVSPTTSSTGGHASVSGATSPARP